MFIISLRTVGRVASGDCSPEAPADPDRQISIIRLFGSTVSLRDDSGTDVGLRSG
jgi:hypothetical protein